MEPMHPADRTYRNQTLRIADLTVLSDTVEGLTFEQCVLIGPAVIVPLGEFSLVSCAFDGPLDELFWIVPADKPKVFGAVAFVDCGLFSCRLERVGLAGTTEMYGVMSAGFGSS